ncbi:MAG TPA: 30S ribosomal protein S12 methylthiotransferase RimO [Steroidobacteraceae bacterium]|jgi:ribosomal protein S12 methylthiotransferase|nr:30S ribosomal protein S12 methylthiotransferase RimO [Steroidobacteraceae bacterium]
MSSQRKASVRRRAPAVGFVSLGCPKALVDSERLITQLRSRGYVIAPGYDNADLVVVNTCGFIDAAIDESLDAIGEALRKNGRVLVTGCLGANPQRILERHPKVLGVTGPHAYERVLEAVNQYLPQPHDPLVDLVPPQGIRLTPRHYAYLKISEGCNNRCSFCIIPSLRGRLASRALDDVLREAEALVRAGVKELLVISQDTSAYGSDIRYRAVNWREQAYESRFIDLARSLNTLGVWVRLHYVYPYPHVDEVVPLMNERGVLPYLDIPFQHASPSVLKRMRRPAHAQDTLQRIRSWRAARPELTLRSSFIVGFPGETDAEFEALLQWLDAAELDRVGCFKYSPVEGAAANGIAQAVPEAVKQERYQRFMQKAGEISAARLARRIGTRCRVLIDAIDAGIATGRTMGDAPEIDGVVRIRHPEGLRAGEFAQVELTGADSYDLTARLLSSQESDA